MEFIKESKHTIEVEEVYPDLNLNTQDEVEEILGNPPTWTMRWGILLILLLVIIGLTVSLFIRYPDIIEAPVILTTEHPPIELVTRQGGKITQLLVTDQQVVDKGQLLAVIENPATYEDVLELQLFVNIIEDGLGEWTRFADLELTTGLDVGEINTLYSQLIQNTRNLQYYLKQYTVFAQIEALENEINKIKKLNASLIRQEKIYTKELALVKKNFDRHTLLNQEEVISDLDLEKLENEYLAANRQLESMRSGVISNEIRIEQLNTQKQSLKADRSNGISDKSLQMLQLVDQILAAIDQWKHNYLIVSPFTGTINFEDFKNQNQYVSASTPVFTIIPDQVTQKIIARGQVPMTGSGKIKQGMNVNIRLEGFPYRQFGTLTTKVERLAAIPNEKDNEQPTYEVEMLLPDTLMTTYGTTISFKHNQSGIARIITKDRSILSRIFEQFLNAIKN